MALHNGTGLNALSIPTNIKATPLCGKANSDFKTQVNNAKKKAGS